MEGFYCVITFDIVQHALNFESVMVSKGIEVKLIPAPRQVSTSCGTAARIPCQLESEILQLSIEKNIPIGSFHKIEKKEKYNLFAKHFNK